MNAGANIALPVGPCALSLAIVEGSCALIPVVGPDESWAKVCMKCLYVYRENTSRQVSAKTRSWEKAEERAQEIRESWSPVRALRRELEAKVRRSEAREVPI